MTITSKGIAGFAAVALAASCGMAALAGCAQQEPVAVTINGDNITEKTITDYVQNFRNSNSLLDDKDWAQWLVDNDRNPSSLRDDAIDYYIRTTVIEQDAKKRNISVGDQDVTAQLDEIKSYYGYDDAQLKEQIEMIGYTTDSYREYIRETLIQEKLQDAISQEQGDTTPPDEDVLSLANTYSSVLNGSKEIKCIVLLPEDKEKAESLQKEAAGGADFDKLAEDNSTTKDYDGWNVLISQDQAVADAVATMNKGDVSGVIEGDSNIFIVKVTDVCTVPEGGFAKVDDIPTALRDEFSANVSQTAKASAFDDYVQSLVDNAEVTRNPMPKGLSYDVSLDGVQPSENVNTTGEGTQFSVDENGNVITEDGTVSEDGTVPVATNSDGDASNTAAASGEAAASSSSSNANTQ